MNVFFAWTCPDDGFASHFRGGGRKDESNSHECSSLPSRWLRTVIHKDIHPELPISLLSSKPCISTKSWCSSSFTGDFLLQSVSPKSLHLGQKKSSSPSRKVFLLGWVLPQDDDTWSPEGVRGHLSRQLVQPNHLSHHLGAKVRSSLQASPPAVHLSVD